MYPACMHVISAGQTVYAPDICLKTLAITVPAVKTLLPYPLPFRYGNSVERYYRTRCRCRHACEPHNPTPFSDISTIMGVMTRRVMK